MGLLGKVVAAKAVKGHRDDKKEKKEEAAEAAKPEEKKYRLTGRRELYPGHPITFFVLILPIIILNQLIPILRN